MNNCEIGCVGVDPPEKDVTEQLLIERRIRNATDVVADSNEGTVIAKDAQTCRRTRCNVCYLLLFICASHHGRFATLGIFVSLIILIST